MPSLPITLTPFSAPWMTWVLTGLFVIITLTLLINGSQVTTAFSTYFGRIERRYTDGTVGLGVGLMMYLFRWVSVSLALYWCLWCLYTPDAPFRPLPLAILLMPTVVVWGVHRLMLLWVCATFSLRSQLQTFTSHYLNLWTALSVVLYVLVLIGSFLTTATPILYLMVLTVVTYPLAVLIKAMSVIPLSRRSLLYVPLYVLTVDVLPFAALFVVAKSIITL